MTPHVIAELVEMSGPYEAAYVKDGAAAIEEAHRRRPHACLLDVDMPALSGIAAAQKIHKESTRGVL